MMKKNTWNMMMNKNTPRRTHNMAPHNMRLTTDGEIGGVMWLSGVHGVMMIGLASTGWLPEIQ